MQNLGDGKVCLLIKLAYDNVTLFLIIAYALLFCYSVLVLAIPPGSYSLNGKRLRGNIALRIKTLEALGYAVVSVSTDDWKSLQDYEKIPFLMQAIRLKALDQFEDRSYM